LELEVNAVPFFCILVSIALNPFSYATPRGFVSLESLLNIDSFGREQVWEKKKALELLHFTDHLIHQVSGIVAL